MLGETRRVEQAERYFERAPDLRRRQRRHLTIAALLVLILSGGALGAAVASAKNARPAEPQPQPLVEPRGIPRHRLPVRISYDDLNRMRAQVEALNVLGLIPVVPPSPESAALEDQR